jgi:23S rRNA pseudouridine1911/1915/1917 synthase
VDGAAEGTRLDAYLSAEIEGFSRSRLRLLIEDESVLVNEKPAKPSYRVKQDDQIEVELLETRAAHFEPENIPLDVVFEDDQLAVINKPAGMVVHPGAGVQSGTLANAIAWRFNLKGVPKLHLNDSDSGFAPASITEANRIGIVHRLDKDTSGLIVVAKDEQTAEDLSRQFHDREVEKSYVALVHGHIEQQAGTIDAPIARDKHNRVKMRIASYGRSSLSLWRVRQRFEKFTLVDVDIKTGRTHQIRVHLSSINHPVVGDAVYNEGRDNTVADLKVRKAIADLNRFFLHAEKLAFTHPTTGEHLAFRQELPVELTQLIAALRD